VRFGNPQSLPRRRRLTALGLLAAALLCAAIAQGHFAAGHAALDGAYRDLVANRDAGLVWYAVAALPLFILCRRQRAWRWPSWRRSRALASALVAVVAFGAWLRFYRLDELPPGLWVDEALNGIAAVEVARSRHPLVALPSEDVRTGLGAGFVDVAALVFGLFDPADGAYGIRSVAALLGIAGLMAVAALSWAAFGPRVALVATGWLAVSQYHVNYSRWGVMPIMSSVVETLLILALFVGLRRRGWRSWAGLSSAGILLGAGLYTYQTFRLFVPIGLLFGGLLLLPRIELLLARWRQLLVAGLLAAVVAAPMLLYALEESRDFSERARHTLVFSAPDWGHQLKEAASRSLLGFQFIGDDNPRQDLPRHPLLSFVPAMLAPLGLVICLTRWRQRRYACVPLWFAAAVVPGAITFEAPHASRLLDAVVPIALMVGIATDSVIATLEATLPRPIGKGGALVLLLAAVSVTVWREYRAYFIERERSAEFYNAFLPEEAMPGRYLEAHRPAGTVFLDPRSYGSPTTRFLARRYFDDLPNDVRLLRLMHDFPPRKPLQRDASYVLSREYVSMATVIAAMFPDSRCQERAGPFGTVDLAVCEVPKEEVNEARRRADRGTLQWPYGLLGRYYHDRDGHGEPYHEAVVPFLFCDYPIDEEPIGRFAFASWEGFIELPRDGEYYFRLNPDSTTLTIGGQRIIDRAGNATWGGENEGRASLVAGVWPIRITFQRHARAPYFLWFYWQPPGEEGSWVPARALHPPSWLASAARSSSLRASRRP
jgi:hypothetical protein